MDSLRFHAGRSRPSAGGVHPTIKAWKTHLAADRTSCPKATANQFRLFLHAGAYWLLWSLRALMPRASSWRVAQFDTLRLRLIKVAARIIEMKTKIKVHLQSSAPHQAVWQLVMMLTFPFQLFGLQFSTPAAMQLCRSRDAHG